MGHASRWMPPAGWSVSGGQRSPRRLHRGYAGAGLLRVKPSRIQAVDHVHLEARPECADELRWFYEELVGLLEVPEDGAATGVLRFRSARVEVHLRLVEAPEVETMGERLAITVPSLGDVSAELRERKIPYQLIRGIDWTDQRLSLLDPAGNRIALRRQYPDAPL